MSPSRRALLWLACKRGTCSYRKTQQKAIDWLVAEGLVEHADGDRYVSATDLGRKAYEAEFAPRETVPWEIFRKRIGR
jgi:hypothetical protein